MRPGVNHKPSTGAIRPFDLVYAALVVVAWRLVVGTRWGIIALAISTAMLFGKGRS